MPEWGLRTSRRDLFRFVADVRSAGYGVLVQPGQATSTSSSDRNGTHGAWKLSRTVDGLAQQPETALRPARSPAVSSRAEP